MARPLRLAFPGGVYHVTARGNERKAIAQDGEIPRGSSLGSDLVLCVARVRTVTDADGKVTTIQRDGNGNPTAIVAPGGQQTLLTLEGNGYLQSITNLNNEKLQMTYSADGLLATLKDALGESAPEHV